jgi:maltose phosphorylase
LGRIDQAYELYLRTSRLDLDDYNNEVEGGLHITSMAGTWLSVVEGFGGMRVRNGKLRFSPQLPKEWKSYSFKVNFRGHQVTVEVSRDKCTFRADGDDELEIEVNEELVTLPPDGKKVEI